MFDRAGGFARRGSLSGPGRFALASLAPPILAVLLLLLPGLFLAGVASAPAPTSERPSLGAFGVPVSALPTLHAGGRPTWVGTLVPQRVVDVGALPRYTVGATGASLGPRSVAVSPAAAATETLRPATLASPAPGTTSAGSGWSGLDSSQCGCSPPDVILAVGPTQVVEMVNLAEEIWTKQGTSVTTVGLSTFFGSGTDFLSDPKVLYDNATGRWFASILDIPSSGNGIVRLAVSQGSNASGVWTVYSSIHPASGEFADQPTLGVSAGLVGIGGNIFASSGASFYGAEYWVVNKTALLNGTTASIAAFGPDSSYESIHPVQSLTNTSVQYFVSSVYGNENSIALFTVSGVPPASVTVNETNLSVSTMPQPPSATEPGSSSYLDTGDMRVQTALWQSGDLWLDLSDGCVPSGGTSTQACIRLIELSTTSGRVLEDFDYGIAGADVYYPAIALDPFGDLTMVYGVTSSSVYASVAITGRGATAPAGTLNPATTIANGSVSVSCGTSACRFGDYFGAARDPSSPTGVFVAGEYLASSSVYWSSWVSPARTLNTATVDLTGSPYSVDTGQTVTFSVAVTNSPCGPALGHCTLVVPFGDGRSGGATCAASLTNLTFGHAYSAAGVYTAGTGGYLAAYSSAGCAPGSLLENLSLPPVTVRVALAPSVLLLALPPAGADVGQSGSFLATTSGGFGSLTFNWTGLPGGCPSSLASQVNCTFAAAGTFPVRVTALDANGGSAVATTNFTVLSAPTVTLSVNRSSLDVGGTVGFTATAQGGTGTYSYQWNGLPVGCIPTNGSVVDCSASGAGRYAVNVSITDTFGGNGVSPNVTVDVHPLPTVNLGPSVSVAEGSSLTLTANVTGGAGGLTYRWSGLPAGCTAANASSIVCQPSATGTYTLTLAVTDAAGGSGSGTVSVTVTTAPAGTPLGGALDVILIAAVVLLAVALTVALLVSRRRRAAPPAP